MRNQRPFYKKIWHVLRKPICPDEVDVKLITVVYSLLIFILLGTPSSFAQQEDKNITIQKFELTKNEVLTNLNSKVSEGEMAPLLDQLSTQNNNQPILFLDNSPDSKDSKDIENTLKSKKLNFVRIDLRKAITLPINNLSQAGKEKISDFKDWWKSKYEAPYASDKRWGVITATTRFGISSMVWFSVGLDPVTAGMLVAGQTAAAYYNTIYERTLDNIFGLKDESKNFTQQIGYRLLYTSFWTYLWRTISGPVKSAHSILTAQGHFEVLTNILSTGFAGNVFGLTKAVTLSRKASMLIGFHGFLIGSLFTTLDLAGVNTHSWFINFDMPEIFNSWKTLSLEIRSSTLMIISYYFSAAYAVRKMPEYFETYANFIEGLLSKTVSKEVEPQTANSSNPSCSSVFTNKK